MNNLVLAVTSVFPLAAAGALLYLIFRTVRVHVEWREEE
jgi:hypothetical protein